MAFPRRNSVSMSAHHASTNGGRPRHGTARPQRLHGATWAELLAHRPAAASTALTRRRGRVPHARRVGLLGAPARRDGLPSCGSSCAPAARPSAATAHRRLSTSSRRGRVLPPRRAYTARRLPAFSGLAEHGLGQRIRHDAPPRARTSQPPRGRSPRAHGSDRGLDGRPRAATSGHLRGLARVPPGHGGLPREAASRSARLGSPQRGRGTHQGAGAASISAARGLPRAAWLATTRHPLHGVAARAALLDAATTHGGTTRPKRTDEQPPRAARRQPARATTRPSAASPPPRATTVTARCSSPRLGPRDRPLLCDGTTRADRGGARGPHAQEGAPLLAGGGLGQSPRWLAAAA